LIAGYLRDRGWSVTIVDQEVEGLSAAEIAAKVALLRPRVVAICVHGHQPSASTQALPGARAVAWEIGLNHKDHSKVILLGNHPSALPEQTLREEPCDFVIDGEGPITLDALLRLGESPSKDDPERGSYIFKLGEIPGLVWRSAEIVRNPLAPPLDLDRDLHGRTWDLLPEPSRYRAHNWQCLDGWPRSSPYAAVYTSLGCSYTCDFCMINVFQHTNRYRRRSPAAVVEEMVWLYRERGVRTFKIVDELFVLSKNHYRAVCQWLVDSGIGNDINVWAYARTDTVREEDLPLMRAAGIRWLALGIESGSSEVRAGTNKALRGDGNLGIETTVLAIRRADINVIGNYIFGLPDDTEASMRETLALAQRLNAEWANFYCAMPYPGSPLYDRVARERPEDLPPSWAAYSQHNRHTVPLRNAHLSAADILRFRDAAHVTYFSSPEYRAMLRARFGPGAVAEVEKMLSYTLDRDLLR
jgi:radical SAM superfamily enzyme YgiQ (UPF0313 family)